MYILKVILIIYLLFQVKRNEGVPSAGIMSPVDIREPLALANESLPRQWPGSPHIRRVQRVLLITHIFTCMSHNLVIHNLFYNNYEMNFY